MLIKVKHTINCRMLFNIAELCLDVKNATYIDKAELN